MRNFMISTPCLSLCTWYQRRWRRPCIAHTHKINCGIHSPSVEGSWRLANIDVIPATGIMAFGKYATMSDMFTDSLSGIAQHVDMRKHNHIVRWATSADEHTQNIFSAPLILFASFALRAIPVHYQHSCAITTRFWSINRCGMLRLSAGRK